MGFLDRLFGAPDDRAAQPARPMPQARTQSADERAIERYRYLLRTAPPESIEAVHTEAFAKLTPEQRGQVYRALAAQAPAGERLVSDEPAVLARAATRAELRAPGTMERTFQATDAANGRPAYGGPSFGSMFGGSMLGTVAGVVVGSMIAQAFLPGPDFGGDVAGGAAADASGTASDASGGDGGFGGDFGGGDFGGDFGF
ncbi:hypothetical protein [Agromyces sp. Leaf222]|uniref:hypothetical protein n=1 Tax=Agromyces sp. Leaf222 TaxID=1735688 RepID=UPI0006FE4350|nr:hypothetical protein [Agromyces sp. Leaf222]KQM83254.1 hypothetical protein ASE68_08485 [Agromyces sp. Leaf222]